MIEYFANVALDFLIIKPQDCYFVLCKAFISNFVFFIVMRNAINLNGKL